MQGLFHPLMEVERDFITEELLSREINLRWALIESALVSIRYSSYFRYHYNKVRSRKNANSAAIAVARRMLEVIYVMLKEGRAYIEKPVDIK